MEGWRNYEGPTLFKLNDVPKGSLLYDMFVAKFGSPPAFKKPEGLDDISPPGVEV